PGTEARDTGEIAMRNSVRLSVVVIVLLPLAARADEGWVSLFDGKTLDGWSVKGGNATYKVEDGAIVGTTIERSPNTFLCRGPYSDFVLEFDVLCGKPLNSGVQIRSHTYEKDTPLASKGGRI